LALLPEILPRDIRAQPLNVLIADAGVCVTGLRGSVRRKEFLLRNQAA
jgi:hypothetical protein